jgi:hypothetical protein
MVEVTTQEFDYNISYIDTLICPLKLRVEDQPKT